MIIVIRKKANKGKNRRKPLLPEPTSSFNPASEKIIYHQRKMRIVGIGGGGSSIVSEISRRLGRISFVVANTDLQALRSASRKANRFSFGQNLTKGLGTGMNLALGEIAAQNEKERIRKLFQGQDFSILVASLGGGTGSGSTPFFAKTAKSLGSLTYGIFTLPFQFEGKRKMDISLAALDKLKPYFNIVSVIPNERIFQLIDRKVSLQTAFSAVNKEIARGLEGLMETIYSPGLINIDFADLRTILEGYGKLTFLSTIETQGANRAEEAIKRLMANPLYPYTINGAKGILFNISGGKNLSLNEVNQISKAIHNLVRKEAQIILGISQSGLAEEKIKITLLAVGCRPPRFFSAESPRPKAMKMVSPAPPEAAPRETDRERSQEKKKTKPLLRKKKSTGKALKKNKPKRAKKTHPQKKRKKPLANKNKKKLREKKRVRRNALEVNKQIEKEKAEILTQEEELEKPAFLRKGL